MTILDPIVATCVLELFMIFCWALHARGFCLGLCFLRNWFPSLLKAFHPKVFRSNCATAFVTRNIGAFCCSLANFWNYAKMSMHILKLFLLDGSKWPLAIQFDLMCPFCCWWSGCTYSWQFHSEQSTLFHANFQLEQKN